MALSETVRRKSDEFRLRIDEVHLLRTLLLLSASETAKASETAWTGLGGVFLRLDGIQDALGLSLVIDAGIVAPAVGGKEERCDEIQLTVAGGTWGVTGTVRPATPSEVALADAVLVLHIFLRPAPQTVEDVLLIKLHRHHQTIRHTLGTGIVVLDVRDIAHRVAYFEVDLVGATENIVEHFLQLRIDIGLFVAHLYEEVTVFTSLKSTLLPRSQCHCRHRQQQHHCHNH